MTNPKMNPKNLCLQSFNNIVRCKNIAEIDVELEKLERLLDYGVYEINGLTHTNHADKSRDTNYTQEIYNSLKERNLND